MKAQLVDRLQQRAAIIASFLCVLIASAIVTACGSGGGGDVGSAVQGSTVGISSQVVSGVAATGAPLVGQVTLRDSSSKRKDKVTVIAKDGSFSIDVSGMTPPFVLRATGTADGTRHTLYSFADKPGIANINPLTSAALASAAGVDDPAAVFERPDRAAMERVSKGMADAVAVLRMKIMPLLVVFNAENRDPHGQSFAADHDGLDGMFDNVRIVISNGILTITNATTDEVILTAQVRDIARGKFTDDHDRLPQRGPRPPKPTGVQAVGGDGQVTVSWDPVANATSYDLFYTIKSEDDEDEDEEGKWIKNVTSPYVVTGLLQDTTYFFKVRARQSFRKGPPSAKIEATTTGVAPSPTVPAAPSGVIATGGTNQITVSWPAVMGATSYNLYWSDTSGVTSATGTQVTGATSPAVLTSLADNKTYYVIVTAVNAVGESAASAQVAATTLPVTPPPTTAPAAPASVNAVGGNGQVSVSWSTVTDATSYNVYWSTTSGVTKSTGTLVAGVTSPFVHTGLTASTAYFYIVTAVNSAGESSASLEATATTNAPPPALPAAPTGVAATGGNQQVTVTWNAVSGATSYNLYWSTSAGVTVATGTQIAGVASPFVHGGLADSTAYYYIVTAVNSFGEGPASGQATATTNAAPTACTLQTAVPTCTSCHGGANIYPQNHVSANRPKTCAVCHTGISATATQNGTSCVLNYPTNTGTHGNGTVER